MSDIDKENSKIVESLHEIWGNIRGLELEILRLIGVLDESGPKIDEELVNKIAGKIGDFGKKLREASDLCAQIEYQGAEYVKTREKATLKYCHSVLDLGSRLINILGKSESIDYIIQNLISEYDTLLSNRDALINGKFYEVAERELKIFHDEDFREKLSLDLESKLKRRFGQ